MATTIAKNLQTLRERKRLTQEELAKRAGVKQSAVSRWESGTAIPEVASLLRVAVGLRVSVEEVVAGTDQRYDLLCHELGINVGHDDLPASAQARIQQLERQLEERDTRIRHREERLDALNDIVTAATSIISLGEQITRTGQAVLGRQDADAGRGAATSTKDSRKRRRSAAG